MSWCSRAWLSFRASCGGECKEPPTSAITTLIEGSRAFKYHRLEAINQTLKRMRSATSKQARAWPLSLMLGFGLIHLLNGVHRAPSTWRTDVRIMETMVDHVFQGEDLPNQDEDAAEGLHTVPSPGMRGLSFLSYINVVDISPRVASVSVTRLRDDWKQVLATAYNEPSWAALQATFGDTTVLRHPERRSDRSANRRGKTSLATNFRPRPDAVDRVRFEVEDVHRRKAVVPSGPDTEDPELAAALGAMAEDNDFAKILQSIWHQFPSDAFQLAPNPSDAQLGSYSPLNARERGQVDENSFNIKSFRGLLSAVWVKRLDDTQWRKLFDRYFPAKGDYRLNLSRQHFKNCRFYAEYRTLMNSLRVVGAVTVRLKLFSLFKQLAWVPYAEGDRLWTTRVPGSKAWERLPRGTGPAPWIALNAELWDFDEVPDVGPLASQLVDENTRDAEAEEHERMAAADRILDQGPAHVYGRIVIDGEEVNIEEEEEE